VSFLVVTIPVTLFLAGVLLSLVLAAVRAGDFDDLEAPSARMLADDDRTPEIEGPIQPIPTEPRSPLISTGERG